MISKISKSEFQSVFKLKQKKFREESQLFFGEGFHFFQEVLKKKNWIEKVLVTEEFYLENQLSFKSIESKVNLISSSDLRKIAETNESQSVLVVLRNLYHNQKIDFSDKKRILYLFRIQDPGNAGTLIRTAAWFGWNCVVFSYGSVEWTNPKIIRATMGAFQTIEIIEDDAEFTQLNTLSAQSEIVLLDMSGKSIQEFPAKSNMTVVVGNESSGLKNFPENFKNIQKITIPGIPTNIESLNASVAGSIALYEFRNVE